MRIKLTADFTTTVTREIEVPDDFNPKDCDLDELWYNKGGSALSRDELFHATGNLQMDEVWLVKMIKMKRFLSNKRRIKYECMGYSFRKQNIREYQLYGTRYRQD